MGFLKRDLVVLFLACVGVYFSLQARLGATLAARRLTLFDSAQNEGAFSFEPAWSFLHADDPFLAGEALLPHPVVADLNGDGRSEVIVTTRDARLLVLEQPALERRHVAPQA